MKPIRPADLAHRLGIRKSAISNAVTRGKLVKLPSGELDLDDPVNAEYLKRFSLHRGRTAPFAASPERAAAALERAQASYARASGKLHRRLMYHVPIPWMLAGIKVYLEVAKKGVRALPDQANLRADPLERELEISLTEILRAVKAAPLDAARDAEFQGVAEPIPTAADVAAMPLDGVKAALDVLHARRLQTETLIDEGFLIHRDECTRSAHAWADSYINIMSQWPRRWTGDLEAHRATGGIPAARERLRELVALELARLAEGSEKVEKELQKWR